MSRRRRSRSNSSATARSGRSRRSSKSSPSPKNDELVPLTVELLHENGFDVKDVSWTRLGRQPQGRAPNRRRRRRRRDRRGDDRRPRQSTTLARHPAQSQLRRPRRQRRFSARRASSSPTDGPSRRFACASRPAQGLIYGPKTDRRKRRTPNDDNDNDATGLIESPTVRRSTTRQKAIWAGYSDVSDDPDPTRTTTDNEGTGR